MCTCITYTGASRESRTFLPAALLPAYLTFAFCLFSSSSSVGRRGGGGLKELGGNLKRLTLSPPTRLVLCVIDVGLVWPSFFPNRLLPPILPPPLSHKCRHTRMNKIREAKRKFPPLVSHCFIQLCWNKLHQTRTESKSTSAVVLQLSASSSSSTYTGCRVVCPTRQSIAWLYS